MGTISDDGKLISPQYHTNKTKYSNYPGSIQLADYEYLGTYIALICDYHISTLLYTRSSTAPVHMSNNMSICDR